MIKLPFIIFRVGSLKFFQISSGPGSFDVMNKCKQLVNATHPVDHLSSQFFRPELC